jgi:hypothetical protein
VSLLCHSMLSMPPGSARLGTSHVPTSLRGSSSPASSASENCSHGIGNLVPMSRTQEEERSRAMPAGRAT